MRESELSIPSEWSRDRLRGLQGLLRRRDPEALAWLRELARAGARLDWDAHLHNAVIWGNAEAVREILRLGLAEASALGPRAEEARPLDLVARGALSRWDSGQSARRWSVGLEAIEQAKADALLDLRQAGLDLSGRLPSWFGNDYSACPTLVWAGSEHLDSNKRARESIAEMLLASGGDFGAAWGAGKQKGQALEWALRNKRLGQAASLLEMGWHRANRKALSPLTACAELGRHDWMALLLEMGEDPNRPGYGVSDPWAQPQPPRLALQAAADRRDEKMCELLLRAGADAERPETKLAREDDGPARTILQRASNFGYLAAQWERGRLERESHRLGDLSKKKMKKAAKRAKAAGLEPPAPAAPKPRRGL